MVIADDTKQSGCPTEGELIFQAEGCHCFSRIWEGEEGRHSFLGTVVDIKPVPLGMECQKSFEEETGVDIMLPRRWLE